MTTELPASGGSAKGNRAYWTERGYDLLSDEWMDRDEWTTRVARFVPHGIALREGQVIRERSVARRDSRALRYPNKSTIQPEPTREDLIRMGSRSKANGAFVSLRESRRLEIRYDDDGRQQIRRSSPYERMTDADFRATARGLSVSGTFLSRNEDLRRFATEVLLRFDAGSL